MRVILEKTDPLQAAQALYETAKLGGDVRITSLEVLDEFLLLLKKDGQECTFISGKKQFDLDLVYRLRYDRGLDPRHPIEETNGT